MVWPIMGMGDLSGGHLMLPSVASQRTGAMHVLSVVDPTGGGETTASFAAGASLPLTSYHSYYKSEPPRPSLRPRLAFDLRQRRMILSMFQPGQVVRVNLAGLQAEGVMFQAAVTDAVGHIVKQTSEQPPKYLVKLLFSFRGVSEVEVPAERIHGDK